MIGARAYWHSRGPGPRAGARPGPRAGLTGTVTMESVIAGAGLGRDSEDCDTDSTGN